MPKTLTLKYDDYKGKFTSIKIQNQYYSNWLTIFNMIHHLDANKGETISKDTKLNTVSDKTKRKLLIRSNLPNKREYYYYYDIKDDKLFSIEELIGVNSKTAKIINEGASKVKFKELMEVEIKPFYSGELFLSCN